MSIVSRAAFVVSSTALVVALIIPRSFRFFTVSLISFAVSRIALAARPISSIAQFKIDFIFLGLHFKKPEDIRFENVLVEYSNLNDWLSDHKLTGRYPEIKINFLTKEKIQNPTFVRITSIGEKTLEQYLLLKNTFQDFLNFDIVYEVSILRMVGFVKACEKDHSITVPVQIFYRSSISNSMDKIIVASPYLLNYQNNTRVNDETTWLDLERAGIACS